MFSRSPSAWVAHMHQPPTRLLHSVFLTGLSGGAPLATGGGSISHLFSERDRASAMALFTLTPLIGELNACENVESAMSFSRWGPAVRPIAGGFISQSQNKVGICRHRDRLGLGGGNSLLAGLAILLDIPFPVWIYYKGESIRQRGFELS
ncbi:hypothetical protein E4T56_gene20855 [Termitomyces sp. T112]|nr:hypothetical protein E4T56_gene20855 [Termitomyces sp. T112]